MAAPALNAAPPGMPSRLQLNVIANLAGRIGSVAVAVVCTPFYLHYLGVEAYGLIGVYLSLFMLASVLDFGLGTTLNREFARRSTLPEDGGAARDLLRTLSLVSGALALTVALLIAAGSGLIAHHWLRTQDLDAGAIGEAIALMGIALALQWPIGLYSGGLSGLQRQVAINVVLLAAAMARGVGAVVVLATFSPTIEVYFLWQIAVGILHAVALGILLGRALPRNTRPARVSRAALRSVGGFAAGVSGITVLSVLASNLDRLLLSAWLPLDRFGHYTLAGFVASLSTLAVAPLFNALLPRFSELIARKDEVEVAGLYHHAAQTVAVVTLPLASLVIAFAPEILLVWTRDPAIAADAAGPARALAFGATCLALANIPYAIQLGHGWTRLAVRLNAAALLVLPLALYWGVSTAGAVGAAIGWAAVNAATLVAGMLAMHRRYLRGHGLRWLLRDTLPSVVLSAAVMACARMLMPENVQPWLVAGILGTALAAALAVCALAAPATRGLLARWCSGPRPTRTGD